MFSGLNLWCQTHEQESQDKKSGAAVIAHANPSRRRGTPAVFGFRTTCCFVDALDGRNSSAVDDEFGAVDIRRPIGYQESNKLGNFLGAPSASDGNAAE